MKKLIYALVVLILVAFVGGGAAFINFENKARAAGEEAYKVYTDIKYPDDFRDLPNAMVWYSKVRTQDGDAGPDLKAAADPFRTPEGRKRIQGDDVDPATVAELELLEAAGAKRTCKLTGGAIPIADNPLETDLPPLVGLLTLDKLMIKKAKALEEDEKKAEAEKELMLLLSVGAHLERDYQAISFNAGLAMQEHALMALKELYEGRSVKILEGRGRKQKRAQLSRVYKAQAADAERLANAVKKRREVTKVLSRMFEMSLDPEGLRELKRVAEDNSADNFMRAEAIVAIHTGHLFNPNRVVLGPSGYRKEVVGSLRLSDPVLADIAGKAKGSLLDMPFSQRKDAITLMSQLR